MKLSVVAVAADVELGVVTVMSTEPAAAAGAIAVTWVDELTVMLVAALSWRLLEKPLIRHGHIVHRY